MKKLDASRVFILIGLGFLIEGTVPRFAAVLLAQFVWGFGWTFVSEAWSAWIADEVGQELDRPYCSGLKYAMIARLDSRSARWRSHEYRSERPTAIS
jgi:hypothetical protein